MSTLLESAMDLADRGFAIFPCHTMVGKDACSCGKESCKSKAKHPRVTDWQGQATSEEDQIREWWTQWPDANIAIATGEISDLWVLDLDQKDYGPENFERFRSGRALAPAVVKTGGGGAHLYFSWDDQIPVRNRAGILKGVDVRGNGGYVIAAGSTHASGANYDWAKDEDLTAAPSWLMEMVHAQKVIIPEEAERDIPKEELARIKEAMDHINPDGRDEWLQVGMALHSASSSKQVYDVWRAWSLRSAKFDPAVQGETWSGFKKRAGNDIGIGTLFHLAKLGGWSATDIRTTQVAGVPVTMGDVWPNPKKLLRPIAPVEFPIDRALPDGPLREYVKAVAEQCQVAPELPAMMVAPILLSCMAKKYEISAAPGWTEATALWVVCALRSGERKSAIMSALTAPLYNWERERAKEYSLEIIQHESAVKVLKGQVASLQKDAQKASPIYEDKLEEALTRLAALEESEPSYKEIVATDTTTEALAALMQRNHERVLVACAEADPLDIALGRYTNGVPNLGVWLNGHAGDTFKASRMSRGPTVLIKPELSMAITPQPNSMGSLFGSQASVDKGFLARFLFGIPESMLGRRKRDPEQIPNRLKEYWQKTCQAHLNAEVPEKAKKITLSEGALDLFNAERDRVELVLADQRLSASMRSWYSKLPGAVLRLSLALKGPTLAENPSGTPLEESLMACALAWVPYLEANYRRAAGAATEDPDAKLANAAVRWIAANDMGGEVVRNVDIYAAIKDEHQLTCRRDTQEAIELLVECDWLKPVSASKARTRPATEKYHIHPDVAQHFSDVLDI